MKRTLALLAISSVMLTATLATAGPLALGAGHRARITAQIVAQKTEQVLWSVRYDPSNHSWRKAASLATIRRLDYSAHRVLRIMNSGNPLVLRMALRDLSLRFGEATRGFQWLRHSVSAQMEMNEVGRYIGELRGIVAQWVAMETVSQPPEAPLITAMPFPMRVVYTPYPPAPPPMAPATATVYTTPGVHVSTYQTY